MICVIATIETIAGGRDELLSVFRELVPMVKAEKGCIEYTPMVDVATDLLTQPSRDDVVVMVEKWDSVAALEAHLASAHMADFRQRTQSLRKSLSLQILGLPQQA